MTCGGIYNGAPAQRNLLTNNAKQVAAPATSNACMTAPTTLTLLYGERKTRQGRGDMDTQLRGQYVQGKGKPSRPGAGTTPVEPEKIGVCDGVAMHKTENTDIRQSLSAAAGREKPIGRAENGAEGDGGQKI